MKSGKGESSALFPLSKHVPYPKSIFLVFFFFLVNFFFLIVFFAALKDSLFFFLCSFLFESLKLCENTRACLDPQLKDYGSVAFTITYLSAKMRVNEAQTIDTTLVHKHKLQTIKSHKIQGTN